MVRWGFEANWFLAASPTRRSSSVKATQEGVIRLPGHGSVGLVEEEWMAGLTLVVGDDFDMSVLHDTHARVRGSQIDTNDGAGDGVGVALVLDGFLGVCCLSQHQTADEDQEKVKGD